MQKKENFNIIKMIFILLAFILLIIVFMVLLVTLLITLFSRHMKKEREKVGTNHEVVVEMKNYLRDKYGYIDYDFVALRRKSTWGDPNDIMVLTTSYGGEDVNFCVERFEQDGKYVCADNYVQFLVVDELEEEMKEFTSNYFSEFKLYANVGGETNVFPMSFKTYDDIKDRYDEIHDIIPQNSFLTFRVYVKESSLSGEDEFNEIEEKYEEDLEKLGYVSCCYLHYVDDETFDEK